MAALVQSFPSQSSTMLQSRPSSSSGILQPSSQTQLQPQFPPNSSNRNSFAMASSTYRAPVAPYAFTSTPALNGAGNNQRPQAAVRTSSAPNVPAYQQAEKIAAGNRSRYPATASTSTTSSSSSSDLSSVAQAGVTRDDTALISTARIATRASRPTSTIITSPSTATFALPNTSASSPKPSPDRYRRPAVRKTDSAGSSGQSTPNQSSPNSQNLNHIYGHSTSAPQPNNFQGQDSRLQMVPQLSGNSISTHVNTAGLGSVDDMQLNRQPLQDQAAKRYRRRSIHTIDSGDYANLENNSMSKQAFQQNYFQGTTSNRNEQHPLRSSPVVQVRPASSHGRTGSSDSFTSVRSNHSRSNSRPDSASKREGSGSMASNVPTAAATPEQSSKSDQPRLVNIPPRGSSDAAKRIVNPSPLSKPVTMGPESPASKDSFASAVSAALQTPAKQPSYAQAATNGNTIAPSPAAQQLAALSGKDGKDKKSKSSRLRRAFSFGSATELRRASAENSLNAGEPVDRSRLRKERFQDAQEAEQARIAQQQEAGGIGESIYSGQGNFFTGSTDNLSISSTASSASIMIRKMGKSMKKSTRSLAGLFRPKSVIGVPAADSAVGASEAQVSMVTVEAEREKVNVNASPLDQTGGGTGFPKLERNSLDAVNVAAPGASAHGRMGSSSTDTSTSRRSIVGGEKERAEVLNAVKKGILKRTGTSPASGSSSPVVKAADNKGANFNLPTIPHVNESSSPSGTATPNDEGQRKTDSVNLPDEDYFMAAVRFRGDSKSAPNTPQGRRNVTFNLQLNNHDTWPSGEYDRRGEIATCNRLTPMLAQQIKEELNTFKMEMEVHDSSKIYTHFF